MASHRLVASASASSSSVLRCCASSSSSSSSSSSQRGLHSSSRLSQAPVPQRTLPKSQAVAGTVPPKTIVEQIKAYPRHPLNAFFHFAPVADPSAGKDEEGKPKAAVMAPSVVTSTDLDTLSDASSTEGKMSARSWRAPELRRKSSLELHQLWYVLAMERNRLWTKVDEWRRAEVLENASRLGGTLQSRAHMVRKSMGRVKLVLNERRLALIDAQNLARSQIDDADLASEGNAIPSEDTPGIEESETFELSSEQERQRAAAELKSLEELQQRAEAGEESKHSMGGQDAEGREGVRIGAGLPKDAKKA